MKRPPAKTLVAHIFYLFALAMAATLISDVVTRIVTVQLLAGTYAVFNYMRGAASALRAFTKPRK